MVIGARIAAFQFVAVGEPRLTGRLIRQVSKLDATVVLDLEDALWDVDDETRTSELKKIGRSHLVQLARSDPGLFKTQRVGVRLNRLSGPYAAADLDALAEVSSLIELECVVLTKVESGAELAEWHTALGRRSVARRGMVPIVETVAGMSRLDDVLEMAAALEVGWLCYGHYDHALDAGWWPFPEPDTTTFWRHARPIVERIEGAGLGYMQPPFFQLNRADGFDAVLGELARCSRRPSAITLGRQQTLATVTFAGTPSAGLSEPAPGSDDPRDAISLAHHVISVYEANRRATASFSVDGRTGEFISPHLYLAARQYLATMNGSLT